MGVGGVGVEEGEGAGGGSQQECLGKLFLPSLVLLVRRPRLLLLLLLVCVGG